MDGLGIMCNVFRQISFIGLPPALYQVKENQQRMSTKLFLITKANPSVKKQYPNYSLFHQRLMSSFSCLKVWFKAILYLKNK